MNDTIKNLIERKSAKTFKNEHISKDNIDLIVKAGLNAPTGMNTQSPLFIIIQDDDMVNKLENLNANIARENIIKINPDAAINFPSDVFHGAKDVIAVVAKKSGPTFIYDGSLAIGNMLNAAWSMGIDSRWIHRAKEVFLSDEGKEILSKLGIKEEVEGIGFCVLGYHDQEKDKTEIKENRVFYI